MKFMITGKNIMLTDALKDTVEKKLGKLERYFSPEQEAHVFLSVQKNKQIIEVTIPFNGMILRGEESTGDMYSSIDNVVEKIERQIIKQKTKLQKRVHNGETLRFLDIPEYRDRDVDEEEGKIVKRKRFSVKPMDLEEAMLEMELLGHSFFVFRNADTEEVNVIYKRKDGNYGIIEPEV
ncbi:ribosome hibernation-promoting factor, HPF/YfiA family [Caloramator mitchellensis]|nr:ribosome-associated translation inhibitor RaiA [Caloramator mitchellensis]